MRRRCHGCKYAVFECGHGEGRPRYTYYLLSTLLGRDQRLKRTYLWWGRYLTQFQMFQFVTNMGQVRCVCLPPSSVLLDMSRIFSAVWSPAAHPVLLQQAGISRLQRLPYH